MYTGIADFLFYGYHKVVSTSVIFMQYEFSDETNRVFSKARGALLLVAFAALLQLLVFLFFHGYHLDSISDFQLSRKFGNIFLFFAIAALLSQSFGALRPLRLIVSTTGSDLPHLLTSLKYLDKTLFCVAVVFVIDIISTLFNHPELLVCIKAV